MMAEIEIPFSRDMAIAVIEGRKVATTRSERKGEIGDVFTIIDPREDHILTTGGEFRLLDVRRTTLLDVAKNYYRLEGFDSPAAFEKTWRALHRGHFSLEKNVYLHFFGRVI